MKNVLANIISVRLANGANLPGLIITYEVVALNGIGAVETANFTTEPTLNQSKMLTKFIHDKVIQHAATQNWNVKQLLMEHLFLKKIL